MTDVGLARQLEAQRAMLLRFARLQLRNDAWAEDAVSETVLAALERPQSFAGRSQLSTWLVGILKHKIIDQLRRRAREEPLSWEVEADHEELIEFLPDGHFAHPPADWGDPEAAAREGQFLKVMEACVEDLPTQMGRVFLMREWLELDSDEICKELAITTTNLWVLLHRARLRLRACLEIKWFNHAMP
ncbi:MAG: sigma-70 family RNA polymerase sigma factor [Pseudomonadota bacterium]|nr:sigma-70 family RNA polymerase sigma factor [Pseudomonadota bacterium]